MIAFVLGLLAGFFAQKAYSVFLSKLLSDDDKKKPLLPGSFSPKSAAANGKTDRGLELSSFLANNAAAAADANQRTGTFLTDVISALWANVNRAVSAEIKNTAEPMFREMLPGPLKTLHFTKCSLGEVPLRLDNAIVHPCQKHAVTGKEFVPMEIDLVWDGQCDIELQADYIGKVGVKHLKLAGRLTFLLHPLTNQLPVVTAVQFGFVNQPQLELGFTGLASVAEMKTIKKTIQKTISDILASMLVLPNRMLSLVDEKQTYFGAYQPPLGVARLTIVSGRGFTEEKRAMRKADVPDIYCVTSLGGKEIWTTHVVKDSTEPVWQDETADVLLDDHNQTLTIRVWDRDEGALDSDDDLGSAKLTVGELLLAGKTKEVELQDAGGRGLGAFISIHCELLKLEPKLESVERNLNHLNSHMFNGLVTILLSQVTGIPAPPNKDKEDPPPVELYFVKATYGQESYFTAAVDGQAATLNKFFRIPLFDCADMPPVKLALYKGPEATLEACEKKKTPNVLVGEFEVKHADILKAPSHIVSSKRPVCENGPSIEYFISMRGLVTSSGEPVTESSSIAPPATLPSTSDSTLDNLTVTVVKGWGFKAQLGRLKSKDVPDVYVKIRFGSSPTVFRTSTKKDNYTPFWDESKKYNMKSHSQVIKIEAWDEDSGRNDEDDFLGKARISVGKVLLAGGSFDVELLNEGKRTGYYVALRCNAGGASPSAPAPSTGTAAKEEAVSSERSLMSDVVAPDTSTIRVKMTAVKAVGFHVQKRRFHIRGDVPDVYCKISVESSPGKAWRTSTIKNNLKPVWNESEIFTVKDDHQIVSVEVFDEDSGKTDSDDYLGHVKTSLKTILASQDGTRDLALLNKDGSQTGYTLTLKCSLE